jgi:hypothetical protein
MQKTTSPTKKKATLPGEASSTAMSAVPGEAASLKAVLLLGAAEGAGGCCLEEGLKHM